MLDLIRCKSGASVLVDKSDSPDQSKVVMMGRAESVCLAAKIVQELVEYNFLVFSY